MKHPFFIILLYALFLSVHALATESTFDIPIDKLPPIPYIQSFNSVSANLYVSEKNVYPEMPADVVSITVYDIFNQIIYQETVNKDQLSEVLIADFSWASDNYTVIITDVTNTINDEFQIE